MSTHRRFNELEPSDGVLLALAAITLATAIVLTLSTTADWGSLLVPLIVWTALIAFAGVFGHKTLFGTIGLDNLLIVGGYLAFGLEPAVWAALVGAAASEISRTIWADRLHVLRRSAIRTVVSAASHIALQGLSLLAAALAYRLTSGRAPLLELSSADVLPLTALFITHFAANNLISIGLLKIEGQPSQDYFRYSGWSFVPLKLALLPFSALIGITFNRLGGWMFAGLCLSLASMLSILYWARKTGAEIERRMQQQTVLNTIGTAMRASLDLPELMQAIHQHLGQLLDARNFYIALYNDELDQFTFPLHSENGELRRLKPCPAGNSAAAHVFRTRRPLLIHEDVAGTLTKLGIDPLDSPASAWLGVPVSTSDRVLGVIVLHSQTPRAYDQSHLDVLTRVATQAAIAISNAQLYSTMRQRATELAIINSVSTAVGSTLDFERVLEIIVTSIGPLIGCQKSAIFVLNEIGDDLRLARSHGLSPTYVESAQELKVTPGERGLVAIQRQLLVVPDVTTRPGFEKLVPIANAEGFRALAEVPLVAQNEIIGTLAVYFAEVHPFKQAEVDVLQTFANQAASAVNNARLYAHTDRALARRVEELSVLERVGRELASTLDVANAADLIIELAQYITGAQMGMVMLLDETGAAGQVIAQRGYPTKAPPGVQPWLLHQGITGRVARLGQPANVADVRSDPDYIKDDPNVRSQLSVPIIREGRVSGVITLEGYQLAAFDLATVSFVQQLANQAAIAIENARLFGERARRINALSQLHQASLALTGSLDLRQVLNRIVTAAHKLTDADTVALHLYDSTTDTFSPGATVGLSVSGDGIVGIRSQGMTRRALQQRRPILVGDTHADPDTNPRLVTAGVRSLILVPVISHDQVSGVLNAYSNHPLKFTDADVQLVSALANQAAAALENARLFETVAEVRDRLGAILDSSREGVLMFDLDGRVAMANSALERLVGIPRGDVEGQRLDELLLHKPELDVADQLGYSASALTALLDQLCAGQQPDSTHDSYELARPSARSIERSGTPVLDASGRLVGWMITVRDVTEERELQRIRDDLTSMIIHDLRSPLTAILSGLYLLREMTPIADQDEIVDGALTAAEQSCRKLLDLVNSLLDISKMEAGRMELERKPTDLAKLVANTFEQLASLAKNGNITLTSQITGDCQVFVDDDKIGRVLTNLVDNALKFTSLDGQVTVLVEPMPDQAAFIRCAVRDTGPGIPPEHIERIFDRFVQAPGASGTRRGTGLGLAFCKLVVEAHGGRIWVESKEAGGSTFYFTLPRGEQ
jgi:PAS domain S-box-containing protein